MPEKDKVFEAKVKQAGIFDFKEVYRFAYEWLVDEGYDVTEKNYSEKISAIGKEVEIEWDAKKKISDYFRFNLGIKWHIIGMTSIEVDQEGKKVKMNKGNFELKAKGVLEKDYEGKWEGSPTYKFFREIYNKYIVPGRIEQYGDKLFGEADEFIAQIKSFLAIEGMH